MLGAILIFLMGVCVGFLVSDHIKDNWPRPKPRKSKSAELRPLIKSAVEAIRRAEQEKASHPVKCEATDTDARRNMVRTSRRLEPDDAIKLLAKS